jgi:hypothetical protein
MKHMERIPLTTPVNREARMGISRRDQAEMEIRKFQFQSTRVRLRECPRLMRPPREWGHLVGKRVGAVTIVGVLSNIEKAKIGWTGGGFWVVKCDCGVYENRHQKHLRHAIEKGNKRQYQDACTACRGLWAEIVKKEFRETGQLPPGGLPTHRAFAVSESPAHKIQKPRIRVKMERQQV